MSPRLALSLPSQDLGDMSSLAVGGPSRAITPGLQPATHSKPVTSQQGGSVTQPATTVAQLSEENLHRHDVIEPHVEPFERVTQITKLAAAALDSREGDKRQQSRLNSRNSPRARDRRQDRRNARDREYRERERRDTHEYRERDRRDSREYREREQHDRENQRDNRDQRERDYDHERERDRKGRQRGGGGQYDRHARDRDREREREPLRRVSGGSQRDRDRGAPRRPSEVQQLRKDDHVHRGGTENRPDRQRGDRERGGNRNGGGNRERDCGKGRLQPNREAVLNLGGSRPRPREVSSVGALELLKRKQSCPTLTGTGSFTLFLELWCVPEFSYP